MGLHLVFSGTMPLIFIPLSSVTTTKRFHPAPILETDTFKKNRTGTFSIARAKKKKESRLKFEPNSPTNHTSLSLSSSLEPSLTPLPLGFEIKTNSKLVYAWYKE
jgi:hypothetical protein